MLYIDPELLSNTSHSEYRNAIERGYRGLRFEEALERQFEIFYTEAHLERVRLAGFLGIVLFALFVLIDISTLPPKVAAWTVSIRLGLVIPTFIAALYISYNLRLRRHMRTAVFVASLVTGMGTVAVIGAALRQGFQIPYEGILLVALFIYLIVCLQWWRALLTNVLTLFAFIVMELMYQTDPQARLYQIIFMLAANAVGAYGGYFLEYSTRTTYLVHALLHELAEHDGLTGLYNRRTLNAHVDRVWRQAIRDQRELAVAMVDIDFFKRYNDRYGHGQGDVALKAVADVIALQARRPLDLAARYGGEEFAVVWYNPIPTELPAMGANLTAAVFALGMPHVASELGKLSISVGIALMKPVPGQCSTELLSAADMALYQAKEQGRNRVIVLSWPESPIVPFPALVEEAGAGSQTP
jgi:diguanylate cyclase (GGDEF)-like protein